MLKNNFIKVMLVTMLALPAFYINNTVFAEPEGNHIVDEEQQIADEISQVQNSNVQNVSQYKQPTSKKKIMFKFLIAMLCVAGSSTAIYLGLTLYKKYKGDYIVVEENKDIQETPLMTPDNLTDAVRNFLDKTDF